MNEKEKKVRNEFYAGKGNLPSKKYDYAIIGNLKPVGINAYSFYININKIPDGVISVTEKGEKFLTGFINPINPNNKYRNSHMIKVVKAKETTEVEEETNNDGQVE